MELNRVASTMSAGFFRILVVVAVKVRMGLKCMSGEEEPKAVG